MRLEKVMSVLVGKENLLQIMKFGIIDSLPEVGDEWDGTCIIAVREFYPGSENLSTAERDKYDFYEFVEENVESLERVSTFYAVKKPLVSEHQRL